MSDTAERKLSALPIAAGFLPWIAFTIVAQRVAADSVAWAALTAVAFGIVTSALQRGRRAPTQLDLVSLLLFTAIAIAGFVGDAAVDRWLLDWGRPLIGVVLGLVLLAVSPIRPFTADYAEVSTPREYWDSPTFRRINLLLSTAWGAAITTMGLAAVTATALDAHAMAGGDLGLSDLILNWVVPIATVALMVQFTDTYPARAAHEHRAARVTR